MEYFPSSTSETPTAMGHDTRPLKYCESTPLHYPLAGCASRPPLMLRLRVDAPSDPCRILPITIGNSVMAASTSVCWQAALMHVQCCSIAPQMHSKMQLFRTSTTSSCSSAAAGDEAASTSTQPANSHGRCGHHDRARHRHRFARSFFFFYIRKRVLGEQN